MIDVSMLNTTQSEECGLTKRSCCGSCKKQRTGALEQAVAQYGAYVLAIIRNRSRGVLTPEDHEEIASDVFFRALERRGAHRTRAAAAMAWRGGAEPDGGGHAEAERLSSAGGRYAYHARPALGADGGMEKRCAAIAQAMRTLPDEDREIFYRFYDLSQTAAQIAEDLHLNASTVRSRLMRGRRTLREALEKRRSVL